MRGGVLRAMAEGRNVRTLLVATDFSVRSDRAIRRAILTARDHDAAILLLHVIDDDQPARIVRAEREAANTLLEEQARTIRESDGLDCHPHIVLGDPFEGIANAVDEMSPDLVVIGPHRRQALKDVFVGTTAERAIRASRRPILMANAVPAGAWRHILLALDMSECSADAARAVAELGLDEKATVTALHVFDTPAAPALARTDMAKDALEAYHEEEAAHARTELNAFLGSLPVVPVSTVVERNAASPADAITKVAASVSADLLVLGTRGRSGLAKLLLGSVCEAVLRTADLDVLAVPPRRALDWYR